ncbi:MAG: hypothetical protein IJF92_00625 [Bacilli bacterium]|nr:hypothetical protein [Bacilli bacterium]MBQ3307682.1 hypothetical protein [Bacilli bacterium]
MSAVKLNELMNSGEVKEIQKSNKKGVLRTVVAKITDYLANRNGRVYPRRIWEKACNSDLVKEQVACNCFFGEANHPFDDRMDIDLTNVSHAIKDINVKDDGVYATIDILDTPSGNIIDKLMEYGSKIGISSRGCGSLNESTNEVQDDYQLFAFDIVARPSVAAARLTESEELMKQGKVIMTESEIKSVLSNYRANVLNESGYTQMKESVNTNNIIKQLMKESQELNRK